MKYCREKNARMWIGGVPGNVLGQCDTGSVDINVL